MDQKIILLTILGMALVTYLPRVLPVLFLSSRTLPKGVTDWLSFVPTAVLAAMLAPALLMNKGGMDVSLGNVFLLAGLPTFAVSWLTKSFFGAVITGMACVALLRLLL